MKGTSLSEWSVRVALLQSGERLPLLVRGALGLPDPDATEFVLTQLRPKGRAVVTMSAYLRAIGRGLAHFQGKGVQLEQRLASGTYFSTQELTAFASDCKRGYRHPQVNRDEAANRYSYFLAYVRWRASSFIGRSSSDISLDRAQKALQRFEKRIAAVAPTPGQSLASPDVRGGLTPLQRGLLLAVIRPEDERNPWQSSALRFRNYAMILLANELGPRAGDVLALKIRDLSMAHRPATVTFHRRHDDPEDPRSDQPVLKTKPRVLTISDSLATALEHWIDKVRSDRKCFPNARKHPFVFTNSRGEPLGKRGYQLVFEKLRNAFPELGRLVSHVLRHDWNERWTEMIIEEGGEIDRATREQCYAMGWADRSSMPSKYARRAIAESANQKITQMHTSAEKRGGNLNRSEGKR